MDSVEGRESRRMKRHQLEHILRASAVISECREFVVIGSQSILGQFPSAPPELLVSEEADLWPREFPERADLIDGSIGELSPFHETFGYYAQGVGPETAILPSGWEDRLVAVTVPGVDGVRGLCLEIHDLLASKAAAGREKDMRFLRDCLRFKLATASDLEERIRQIEQETYRALATSTLKKVLLIRKAEA